MPATLLSIVQHWNHPMYLVTISGRGHQVVLCLPNCSPHPPPPSPFLNCLPSVTQSVTSPVILPCVCKSWLFVLKHVNPGGRSSPPPHHHHHLLRHFEKKKNKQENTSEGGAWRRKSLHRCFLTYLSRPPSLPPLPPASIRSSIRSDIHPSVDVSDDQDWNHQSGLLEEAMVTRRAVVLCRRCSGWRFRPFVFCLFHFILFFFSSLGLSTSPLNWSVGPAEADRVGRHLFLFHTLIRTHTHSHTLISYRHEHEAGTDVAAWACWIENTLIHTHIYTHTAQCLASLWRETEDWMVRSFRSVDDDIFYPTFWRYQTEEGLFLLH